MTLGGLSGLTGCAASIPPPTDALAAADREIGRAEAPPANVPDAKLHLELAREDINKARALLGQDDAHAQTLINRANAEAAFSMALTQQAQAQTEAAQVTAQLNQLQGK